MDTDLTTASRDSGYIHQSPLGEQSPSLGPVSFDPAHLRRGQSTPTGA